MKETNREIEGKEGAERQGRRKRWVLLRPDILDLSKISKSNSSCFDWNGHAVVKALKLTA